MTQQRMSAQPAVRHSDHAPADIVPLPTSERRWFLWAVWLSCVVFLGTSAIADPDLWGHTLYGLRAIELGVLVERDDPFSYTASGARWINHEWLTESIYGLLWTRAGNVGLTLWRNLQVCALFAIAAVAAKRARAGVAALTLLWILTAEALGNYFIFVRPQIATFVFFALFLLILRHWWDNPRSRSVWALAPLMAVWVNLHGGFLAGCGMVGLYCGAAVVRQFLAKRGDARIALCVLGLVAGATLVNPYGLELHRMLWEHLGTEQLVREWQPLWAIRQSPVYYAPFVLILVSLAGWRNWKAIDALVIGVTMWQACFHVRHIALLSVAVLILLPGPLTLGLRRVFPQLHQRWSAPERARLRGGLVAAAVMLPLVLQGQTVLRFWREGVAPWEIAVEGKSEIPGMPLRAVSVMRESGLSGNLLTDYGWGQFMLWHLYPETRVAFDGRYRTVYPANLEAEFLEFQTATVDADPRTPIVDSYPTDLAILPTSSKSAAYLSARDDWQSLYRDDQAELLARTAYLKRIGWEPPAQPTAVASGRIPQWSVFPGVTANGTPIAKRAAKPVNDATLTNRLAEK